MTLWRFCVYLGKFFVNLLSFVECIYGYFVCHCEDFESLCGDYVCQVLWSVFS